jgi:hypothetical protein
VATPGGGRIDVEEALDFKSAEEGERDLDAGMALDALMGVQVGILRAIEV